ncbi:MAG: glutathione S-transferase N-terminal domain-containing protein [Proteobacteria bacterium]|nr:glutathione S-transferase N-terminal domain-containing protein [Pseudomonadota bacterium]
MKLIWSPASPYARKVRVVAHERGLTARMEETIVDVFSDPADLIAVNPLGKVPALICEDGAMLYDSPVICAYLDAHPAATGPTLIPTSGAARWNVLKAEALADGTMDLALGLTLERRKPEHEKSPTTTSRWRGQLTRSVEAMAREIAVLPRQMTLGHLAIACALAYLDFRHPDLAWRQGRASLANWYADAERRAAMTATTPR